MIRSDFRRSLGDDLSTTSGHGTASLRSQAAAFVDDARRPRVGTRFSSTQRQRRAVRTEQDDSRPAQQEHDQRDDEDRSEYSAADVHVDLLKNTSEH